MDNKSWTNQFDERQRKEIGFSRVYAEQYAHGTDGHNAKMIIAKMALILDRIQSEVRDSEDARDSLLVLADILGIVK